MDSVSPLKIVVSQDTYIINGGLVVNYHNSLNFRRVRKNFNQEAIPYIEDNLTNNHIYTIGGSIDSIEIYLMATFKAPSFWVPGSNFLPLIDNAWIVRKEIEGDGTSTIFGSIYNYEDYHMRFDSVPSLEHGYACNLSPIGTIQLINGQYVVRQSLNGNYIFTRFFDSRSFAICNNTLGISQDSMSSAMQALSNIDNRFISRGNIESQNGFGKGAQEAIGANDVPLVFGGYLESSNGI